MDHEHKQRCKQYYLDNKEKLKQYNEQYYLNNKEKKREYENNKLKTDPIFKIITYQKNNII